MSVARTAAAVEKLLGPIVDAAAAVDAMIPVTAMGSTLALCGAAMLPVERPVGLATIEDRSIACLERVVRSVEGPWLCGGLAGLGTLLAYLKTKLEFECDDGLFDAIDRRILSADDSAIGSYGVELLYGWAGIAAYAEHRAIATGSTKLAHSIANRLLQAEVPGPGVFAFRSPFPETTGEPYDDYGVAHGLAGVIGALGILEQFDDRLVPLRARAERKIFDAFEAGLRRQPEWPASVIPASCWRRQRTNTNVWSNGDLGIIAGLIAGRRGQRSNMPDCVHRVIQRVAEGELSTNVSAHVHANLCHGASGTALVWHIVADYFADSKARTARDRALTRTLELVEQDATSQSHGLGSTVRISGDIGFGATVDPGCLFYGEAGVAAVLLTAMDALPEGWQALLGLPGWTQPW